MQVITISNFEEWRKKARESLQSEIPPDAITWTDSISEQVDLFQPEEKATPLLLQNNNYHVPKSFLSLASIVACHRDLAKWQKLYQALWRLTHGEKNLLQISSDPLMHDLYLLEKAVKRDSHKMKAFVRFREYQQDGMSYFIAFHEPDHHIIRRVAPFFQRRFSVIHWTIITQDETATWDGLKLAFYPGVKNFKHEREDALEDLWRTYYGAIFNPARIKLKAMRNEMPVRYWQHLPETQVIDKILMEAPERVALMMKYSEGLASSAKDYFPQIMELAQLKLAAAKCRACSIYACAKQTVFGHGAERATIMIVGEQPGKTEDKEGRPLIGPSGKLIRALLTKMNIMDKDVYFTNAVKHFKHRVSDGKVIYQTPTINEINACKPWLEAEIDLIQPKIIICLGLIAAKSLLSGGFHLKAQRGNVIFYKHIPVVATYHPAAILRAIDNQHKHQLLQHFTADIDLAINTLSRNINS